MPASLNFTKTALESIKPHDTKRTIIRDTKTQGLILRVETSGSKTFCWLRKGGGTVRFKRIGSFPDVTVEQARGKASEHNSHLEKWSADDFEGENPFERHSHIKLGEVLEHYCEHHLAKHSVDKVAAAKNARWQFNLYMPHWKERRLNTITTANIEELHIAIGDKHGESTANHLVKFLRTLFYHAIEKMSWNRENPARNPKRRDLLYDEKPRKRSLENDEPYRMFQALKNEPNEVLRDFVLLSLMTGARSKEVRSMKWEELDFTNSLWKIKEPVKRRRKAYNIFLVPEAIAVLRQRKNDSKFVFPSWGKTGYVQNLKGPWKELLKRANISEFRVHDLRRTFGSFLANENVSLLIIGSALGHQSSASTETYAQISPEATQKAVSAGTRALLAAKPEEEK